MANLTLGKLTSEPSYTRVMIRGAAEAAIAYTELNLDARTWQAHTDALAEKLRQTTIDYLAASIYLDAHSGRE